jgi:hypothetical protein
VNTRHELDATAWRNLELAGTDAHSGFRYVSYCTIDGEGNPQARMVVLRAADASERTIEIHTDVRSAKWQETEANPTVTFLGFDPGNGLQLRLQGNGSLHGPGSKIAERAWENLSPWTRETYSGGPPGDTVVAGSTLTEADSAVGRSVFGVVVFRASRLDWFQLHRGANERAIFDYDLEGALLEVRSVNP